MAVLAGKPEIYTGGLDPDFNPYDCDDYPEDIESFLQRNYGGTWEMDGDGNQIVTLRTTVLAGDDAEDYARSLMRDGASVPARWKADNAVPEQNGALNRHLVALDGCDDTVRDQIRQVSELHPADYKERRVIGEYREFLRTRPVGHTGDPLLAHDYVRARFSPKYARAVFSDNDVQLLDKQGYITVGTEEGRDTILFDD